MKSKNEKKVNRFEVYIYNMLYVINAIKEIQFNFISVFRRHIHSDSSIIFLVHFAILLLFQNTHKYMTKILFYNCSLFHLKMNWIDQFYVKFISEIKEYGFLLFILFLCKEENN